MADRPTDRADFNRRMSDKIKKEDFVRLDLSLIYPAAASAALVMPRCSFTNFWPDGKTYRSSVHTMLRPSFDRDSSIDRSDDRAKCGPGNAVPKPDTHLSLDAVGGGGRRFFAV